MMTLYVDRISAFRKAPSIQGNLLGSKGIHSETQRLFDLSCSAGRNLSSLPESAMG
jgi:hypothetical protein